MLHWMLPCMLQCMLQCGSQCEYVVVCVSVRVCSMCSSVKHKV